MKTIKSAQRKGFIGAQNEAAVQNQFAQPQTKRPIGFIQKESRVMQEEPKAEMLQLAASTSTFGLPAASASQLTDLLISSAQVYFEKRANNCFLEGAQRELLERIDKIFVRYFDKIV